MARVATGRLCDVKCINTILIYQFGDLLVGFATVVLPVVQSYAGLVAFVVFYGFGDGIFITTKNSLLMFTVDEKRRAAALGLGSCLISMGYVAGAPVAGELTSTGLFCLGMHGVVNNVSKLFFMVYTLVSSKKNFAPIIFHNPPVSSFLKSRDKFSSFPKWLCVALQVI